MTKLLRLDALNELFGWTKNMYLDKLFLFSHHLNYVLHYGPLGGSKNGEAVINYRYGLPDESWPEPDPHDPYSLIDKVGAKFPHIC